MKRTPIYTGSPAYRQLWRVVDGAVRSCLAAHPEYLANPAKTRVVCNSIVKRVTGQVLGYVEEIRSSSTRVRSGFSSADETANCLLERFAEGDCAKLVLGEERPSFLPTYSEVQQ